MSVRIGDVLADLFRERPCERCPAAIKHPGLCGECSKVEIARRDAEDALRLRAELRREVELAIERLPKRRQWSSFSARELRARVENPDAIDAARALVDRELDDPIVTLIGTSGAGKTSIAVALYRALLGAMRHPQAIASSLFIDAGKLASAPGRHRLGDGDAREVELAMRAPVLVIDDLGSEPIVASNRTIPDVIRHRENEGMRTIITTGCEQVEIATMYGAGIARRLFESGPIRCDLARASAPLRGLPGGGAR